MASKSDRSLARAVAVSGLVAVLAALGAVVWQAASPSDRLALPRLASHTVHGLTLGVPDVPVTFSTGDATAGRVELAEPLRRLKVLAAWSEAPESAVGAQALIDIQRAWLSALRLSGQVGELVGGSPTAVNGHAAATSSGAGSEPLRARAITWVCPATRRVVHALISGMPGMDLGRVADHLAKSTHCHGAKPPPRASAAPGPATQLKLAPGWRALRAGATRRTYSAWNGALDAIAEEGPAPAGSPVEHVMANAELWPALLTGVVGRQIPVERAGAQQVSGLAHGHRAVRVTGGLVPTPAPGAPVAPILYVESTIWSCERSGKLVSVSAVTPDRRALAKARPVLDSARCH